MRWPLGQCGYPFVAHTVDGEFGPVEVLLITVVIFDMPVTFEWVVVSDYSAVPAACFVGREVFENTDAYLRLRVLRWGGDPELFLRRDHL